MAEVDSANPTEKKPICQRDGKLNGGNCYIFLPGDFLFVKLE